MALKTNLVLHWVLATWLDWRFEDKLGAALGSCDLVGLALGVASLDGLELKDGAMLGI